MVRLSFQRYDSPAGTDRRPLVMAHGLLGQGRNFTTLARGFAEKRPVIVVDMRNHGDSPWDDAVTYPDMAEDLAEIIAREADGEASVLGHSMGGKATIALLQMFPERVAGAIIADIAPVTYTHSHAHLIDAMQEIDIAALGSRRAVGEALAAKVTDSSTRAFLLLNLRLGESGPEWKPNLDVLKASMDTLVGWADVPAATRYRGPVFSIRGGESVYVGEDGRAALQALYPQTEFAEIAGTGHWLHAEDPKSFFAKCEAFLSAHGL